MVKFGQKRLLVYLAVAALLIFLYWAGALRPVEIVFTKAINPLAGRLYSFSAGIRKNFYDRTGQINLPEEVNRLTAEVDRLAVANASLSSLKEENEVLRKQLNFLQKNKFRYVTANVVARGDIADSYNSAATITIDKGKSDGLYPGLPVIAGEGIIVGKISEVKDNIAQAELTNSKNCKLAAAIIKDSRTSGIVQGELGLTISMGFIPQSAEIKTDDLVVTSGLEKSIPRGLVIGRVISVNREKNELWQTANLEPLENPDNLVIVSVLIP